MLMGLRQVSVCGAIELRLVLTVLGLERQRATREYLLVVVLFGRGVGWKSQNDSASEMAVQNMPGLTCRRPVVNDGMKNGCSPA